MHIDHLWMLIASIVGLFIGPILMHLFPKRHGWSMVLDGFVLTSVGGLCLFHLLPHALHDGGLWAVLLMVAGFLLPNFLDRIIHGVGLKISVAIFIIGFAIHTALDGAALAGEHGDHSHSLEFAVLIHRIPVGLLIYALLKQARGSKVALVVIALMAGSTVFGFMTEELLRLTIPHNGEAFIDALVVGGLLHVIGHQHLRISIDAPVSESHQAPDGTTEVSVACGHENHHHDHHHDHQHSHQHDHDNECKHDHKQGLAITPLASEEDSLCSGDYTYEHAHHNHSHSHFYKNNSQKYFAVFGGLLGLIPVLELSVTDHVLNTTEASLGSMKTFWVLILDSAPALVVAYLLAGMVSVFFSKASNKWLSSGSSVQQSMRGLIFGLPLPVCSCGVLPLYEALVRRGVPGVAAVSFLIATPELGLDAILISIPLLGADLTFIRLGAAIVVALVVSLIVGKMIPKRDSPVEEKSDGLHRSTAERFKSGLRYGLIDVVDHTLPWVGAGLILAALVEPLLSHSFVEQVPQILQVPLFAAIGIPLYVCASGATPLAAVAIHKGISTGAALAFLLSGPATNITTFGILTKLHGKRIAWMFGFFVIMNAVVLGWAVDLAALTFDPQIDIKAGHAPELYQYISIVLLMLLFSASLLRQGPRGILQQVFTPIVREEHLSPS